MASKSPKPDTEKTRHSETPEMSQERKHEESHAEEIEDYGGGFIKARRGWINIWLLIVYAILLVWAIYYGINYWGGLGPGLDY